ncbi:MAG: Maf family protein [Saccharofermentanales bacterium]|jgi:septum formation protein
MKLILASQSPRRRELLAMTGFSFDVVPAACDERHVLETLDDRHSPTHVVEALSFAKAARVLEDYPDAIVIGADTVVSLDGVFYGKPEDEADARRMLRELAGRTHLVATGVTILAGSSTDVFSVLTDVTFYPLSSVVEELIDRCVATGAPLDKAGAYGIQELGGLIISGIDGDFFSVMGLPVAEVYQRLAPFAPFDQ